MQKSNYSLVNWALACAVPSGKLAYGGANVIGLESIHFFRYIMVNIVHTVGDLLSEKSACLIPFSPGLCFLNFTLKNQCALYIPISLASLFGSSSQRQRGLLPFLRGNRTRRKYTDRFISAHQLFWTHQRWSMPTPPLSSPYSEEELHPLLKAHTVPSRKWLLSSLSPLQCSPRTESRASASRQPPMRAEQRAAGSKSSLLGGYSMALVPCGKVSFGV